MNVSTENPAPVSERTAEQMHAEFLARKLNKIAEWMRDLAEDAERAATQVPKIGQLRAASTYASIVTEFQGNVAWKLANAGIHYLTTDAADADLARARRLAGGAIADGIALLSSDPDLAPGSPPATVIAEAERVARDYARKEG